MIHSTKEIDLARTCLRKWAAKYLHRCPDPNTTLRVNNRVLEDDHSDGGRLVHRPIEFR